MTRRKSETGLPLHPARGGTGLLGHWVSFQASPNALLTSSVTFFKKILFIYFQREGKAGRKRRETLMCERNINQFPLARPQMGTWPTTQACALTRNQIGDLLVCRPVLNPLSHTSQGQESI